jgi:hypothetical protein
MILRTDKDGEQAMIARAIGGARSLSNDSRLCGRSRETRCQKRLCAAET